MPDTFIKGGTMFELYQKVFNFHKRHAGACTDEEWTACVKDLGQFKTPFEVALAMAVITEIERGSEFVNRSKEDDTGLYSAK